MKPQLKMSTTKQASSLSTLCVALCALLMATISKFNSIQAIQQQISPPPPQNTAHIHQAMTQMLQVFNGNESHPTLDSNHFKLLELVDEDTLLVGARNVVYNLSLTTLREQRRLEWPSSEDDIRMCRVKGKSPEQCQNYIRVLKMATPDTLLVCGTNAYKPRCRQYFVGTDAYELTQELSGEGACPYQENQNVTSTFADGQLYSATAAQFSGIDGLIHRQPLRTEQFNPKQLNSPNFVSSFRYGAHVYFLFREIAVEHINCGKTIYSRIARVCINDSGGSTTRNRERWTSFVKARLNCSIPGEFPFYFDEIQAATRVVSTSMSTSSSSINNNNNVQQNEQHDLLYAIFTTPTNSIGGSAVCAYRMSDILAAFEGPFKAQSDTNSNWLPVPESRVPSGPRPGSCAVDSKRLPDEHVNFIKENPLMDTAVQPLYSQPLISMASINFRFTQIVVDAQVESYGAYAAPNMRTDVLYVATDDGRVFKLINTFHLFAAASAQKLTAAASSLVSSPVHLRPQSMALQQQQATPYKQEPIVDVSTNTLVIEELHLFDSRTPVQSLLIDRGRLDSAAKLLVLSSKQLKAIPLSRCERALTCQDCLALYDPYCAWDTQLAACIQIGRGLASSTMHYQQHSIETTWSTRAQQVSARGGQWFPASNSLAAGPSISASGGFNNHTLAWWSSCPSGSGDFVTPAQQTIGAPFRALFSSHMQVPNRFDYQSGHHLSRTQLIALPQIAQMATSPTSALGNNNNNNNQQQVFMRQQQQQQPVSECLTFCGGVYQAAPITTGPHNNINTLHDQTSSSSSMSQLMMMNCADYLAAATTGGGASQFGAQLQMQAQNLYTSENLYFAVIICALFSILMGLLFGFLIGRNVRQKNESSICSSTFDETNLYMASINSAHASACHAGSALFANTTSALHPHHAHSTTAQRLAQHPAYLAAHAASTNYTLGGQRGGGGAVTNSQATNGASGSLFEASQCLLGAGPPASDHSSGIGSVSTYSSQQQQQQQQKQMLFQLQPQQQQSHGRTGALPPIPSQHQPLVNMANNYHTSSQLLTPNSNVSQPASTTSTSTTSSSSSATTAQAAEQQFHYLNQASKAANPTTTNLHQRTFTNSSMTSCGKLSTQSSSQNQTQAPLSSSTSTFGQQQQQQPLQANNNNNNSKIYL